MKKLFLSILLFSASAFSATGNSGTIFCTVKSFNDKIADLICDQESKKVMKTPRAWIPKSTKLAAGEKIQVELTREQFQQWPSFNKSSKE